MDAALVPATPAERNSLFPLFWRQCRQNNGKRLFRPAEGDCDLDAGW
jgi:hypothetical protein